MAGVLGMILAGGEGSRLRPLTESRSKPSVPFGGSYRLIDFALNNFVNADLMRIYVLTQFKSQSLFHHLKKGVEHQRHYRPLYRSYSRSNAYW